MKMKKVWALLVSLLLVASMALPVALAVSDDQGRALLLFPAKKEPLRRKNR